MASRGCCFGLGQTYACARRQLTEKRRGRCGCCCEFFSHLVLFLLLAFGYLLSEEQSFPTAYYDVVALSVPGTAVVPRRLSSLATHHSFAASNSFAPSFAPSPAPFSDDAAGDDDSGLSVQFGQLAATVTNLLNGPLAIPPLDLYVRAAQLVTSAAKGAGGLTALALQTSFGQTYQNLLRFTPELYLAPAGALTDDLVAHLNRTSAAFRDLRVTVFASPGAAEAHATRVRTPFALLVVKQASASRAAVDIRMDYRLLPNTNLVVDRSVLGLDADYQRYFLSGFLSLQLAVDGWLWERAGAADNGDPQCRLPAVAAVPFPTIAYAANVYYSSVGFLLGLAMTMATLYPVSRLTKTVVEEKESGMREVMKIMGLRDWANQLAWLLTAALTFLWIAVSSTALSSATFLQRSNLALLFVYFFLFCMSEVSIAFFVSVFFSNAKLAAICAPVFLFVTILPRFAFLDTNQNEVWQAKYAASLLPATAFSFGADIIASLEYTGVGLQVSNAFDGEFSFAGVLQMLLLDTLLYGALAWYLDQVFPHALGTQRHPLFLLAPSYWLPGLARRVRGHVLPEDIPELRAIDAPDADENVEPLPPSLWPLATVRVARLSKRYASGKVAVRGLSVALVEGQITCLLGHNGAGKSTTVAVLTGLAPASEGEVSVLGLSLACDLDAIREQTGVCPQHNVLFRALTVHEHLRFFGNVKGLWGRALETGIASVVAQVGLTEKLRVPSEALSGGMKRKLSLAMALIGDPKFVLLDEPTSGMDPYSRRSTWEMLQRSKAGRVVLLTTHFMDEADVLGDRVVIMSEGRVRCSGSPLFLKTRFGAGYVLSMAASPEGADVSRIERCVRGVVPDALLLSAVAGEVTFRLPLGAVGSFAQLFRAISADAAQLGVGSFGVSITSLEQVFTSLAREAREQGVPEDDGLVPKPMLARAGDALLGLWGAAVGALGSLLAAAAPRRQVRQVYDGAQACPSRMEDGAEPAEEKPLRYAELARIQLLELLRKRVTIARRDLKGAFFGVIFPALQILGVLAILTISLTPESRPLAMNASIFRPTPGILVGSRKAWLYDSAAASTNRVYSASATSRNMSRALIDTYYSSAVDRRAGLLFKDEIRAALRVDWPSAKTLLYAALDGFGDTEAVLLANVSYARDLGLLLSDGPLRSLLGASALGLGVALPSQLLDALSLNATLRNVTTLDALVRLIDEQPLVRGNLDLNGTLSRVQALFNRSALSVSLREVAVSVDRVSIVFATDSIRLSGLALGINGTALRIGQVDLSVDLLVALLPDSVKEYAFALPSAYTVMHNSTSPHAFAALRGELLRAAFANCSGTAGFDYSVRNHPLPATRKQSLELRTILSVFASIFILIPLCYIPSAFIVFIVRERTCKALHLQYVSSVSPYLYWLSVYVWDMAQYLVIAALTMSFFFLYGQETSQVFVSSASSTAAVFLLLLVYGSSIIPLSYLYSMAFDNHSTAQISILSINFFTGFVFVLAYFVMSRIPLTSEYAKQLVLFFRLFPGYNIGEGFINIATAYFRIEFLGRKVGFFEWEVAGRSIAFMAAESVGYFLLVLLTESSYFKRSLGALEIFRSRLAGKCPAPSDEIDEDVAAEQAKVAVADPQDFSLFLRDVQKTYPSALLGGPAKFAVKGISLACPVGERFGLLGINGAGKTTTLSILTGDTQPTLGEAYIAGLPLSDPGTRKHIGFCPQVDPILELMTGFETLWFYGRIRGIGADVLRRRVQTLVEDVGLLPFASKPCGTYSGGNKRKLSLAVALIGDPKILLLDEPSTGMDPQARRDMWDLISRVSHSRSVVLTTHSMEECEALCSRVGIMVSGRLKCLGSSQHLKGRFGTGYQIEVRAQDGAVDEVLKFCSDSLAGVSFEERQGTFIRLSGSADLDLGATFSALEANKAGVGIVNYSISQSTLEQVFIKFAKEQEEEQRVVGST